MDIYSLTVLADDTVSGDTHEVTWAAQMTQ